jgi:FkbM family methyltransferase
MRGGIREQEMTQIALSRFAALVDELIGADSVGTIIEAGARDCGETLDLAAAFPRARIITFECNPATLPACRANVRGYERIRLIEKAVSDRRGTITFFPTDPQRTVTKHPGGNPGASSLFRAAPDYPHETYVQNEISVETTTLADVMEAEGLSRIDLLWMDVQGAELMALRGLGDKLATVGMVHLEVEFLPIYQGQPLFGEVHGFMRRNSFRLLGFTSYSRYTADAVYASPRVASFFDLLRLCLRHPYLVRYRLVRLRHWLKKTLLGRS